MTDFQEQIFHINSPAEFEYLALQLFHFQYENVQVYHDYAQALKINPQQVDSLEKIPFLPISLFKTHKIMANGCFEQTIFESSGTTGMQPSKHYIADTQLYEKSFTTCFEQFFGATENYVILALLPSYIERGNSSLVYMVDYLIKRCQHTQSGFYGYNFDALKKQLETLKDRQQKTILFGVGFALLDFIEQYSIHFPDLIVFETGGMKTRRKEISRADLHQRLQEGFHVPVIYSEYGMTELLSQAYSTDGNTFQCPAWMKILLRDMQDPLSLQTDLHKKGGINVIDLANIYSCAFIATQDIGRFSNNNQFEVLGRFDNADIRGCNMLME